MRARAASNAISQRAEDMRSAAHDRAQAMRERAVKAKEQAVAAKDSVVRLKDNVQQRIASVSRKTSTSGGSARKLSSMSGLYEARGLTDALTSNRPLPQRFIHSRLQ